MQIFQRATASSRSSKKQARRQKRLLDFQQLEDRRLLATFTVTSTTDGPVAGAGDLPGSLRQAIFDANANPGDDTIEFDSLVFTGGDASLVRLTAGELVISESLTLDASTAINVTVTGDANGDDITDVAMITDVAASFGGAAGEPDDLLDDNSRVLNFSASTGKLTLDGLAITGGRTTGDGIGEGGGGVRFQSDGEITLINSVLSGNSILGNFSRGGGLHANSGSVSLVNSMVSGNSTSGEFGLGGGLYTKSGNVSLLNSTVTGNRTTGRGGRGGGISTPLGNISLIGSTVSDNSSWASAQGGGISTWSGNVSLKDSTVSGNKTTGNLSDGGGVFSASGHISLINSEVIGNRTFGGNSDGGGIRGGSVSLTNSTVSGNSTAGISSGGGGIEASARITLTNSTVSGNSTGSSFGDGGGISTVSGTISLISSAVIGNNTMGMASDGGGIHTSFGNVLLTNSTVSGNSAAHSGGGISIVSGDVSLTSSTISSNVAVLRGGGIYVYDRTTEPEFTLVNSIVAGNSDNGTAPDLRPDPDSLLAITHSLIGDNTGTSLTAAPIGLSNADGNVIGMPGNVIDPLLGPLAYNGGPTQTHALLPGSPAINAGSNAMAIAESGQLLHSDQRGFTRVAAGGNTGTSTIDMGAYEFGAIMQPQPPVVISVVRDEGGELARPDRIDAFAVSFDKDVSVNADDLMIRNDTLDGVAVDLAGLSFSYNATMRTATWDFNGQTLDPAYYMFELSDDIDSVVENLSLDGDADLNPGGVFFQSVYIALPGDANLDGQVDVLDDTFALVGNLGAIGGATWAQGDFNGDGNVDVLGDAFILVGQLGQSVVPPTAAMASAKLPAAIHAPQAFTNSVALTDPPASFAIEQEEDRETEKRSTISEQLVLAGSEDLDGAFASDNLLDDAGSLFE